MFTLRCTKNLLGRFGGSRTRSSAPPVVVPTTRLGDWHANVFYRPGAELVLAVNDRSLLPVVVSARPGEFIVARLVEAITLILQRLDVPAESVAAELSEMAEVQIAPTRSRQILGSLNDFERMFDYRLSPGSTLVDAVLELAEAPCGPISMRRPREVAVALLAAGE